MKLLRVWLLVVLAVLLPVRGAMAATMLCAPSGPASHHQGAVAEQATGHADAHSEHAPAFEGHPASHHGAQASAHGDGEAAHDHPAADRCDFCSASCSGLPLPSATAGIDEPAILKSVSFPDLSAPPPTFQSGGQERPPRTL